MGYIPPPPPPPDETERYLRALSIGLDATVSLEGIMAQMNTKPMTPKPDIPPATQRSQPVTGPTTRLPLVCRACGDVLPPGAAFCIQCGAKV